MNKKALYSLSYGVFVLAGKAGDKINACITNTCMQVANSPTRVAIAVLNGNYTRELVQEGGVFCLTLLDQSCTMDTIRHFGMQSGRDVDKFADFADVERSRNGLLYLTEHVNAMFSCTVKEVKNLGSHMMFIGEVTESKVLGSGAPCTYAHYHKAIKPKR